MAAEKGHLNIVKLLLEKDKNAINVRGKIGKHLIHLAVDNGHLGLTQYLLEETKDDLLETKGVDIELMDDNGCTPFICAAMRGQEDILKYLGGRGANINAQSVNYNSALHYAAIMDCVEIAKYLIAQKEKIDLNQVNWCEESPLLTIINSPAQTEESKIIGELVRNAGAVAKPPTPEWLLKIEKEKASEQGGAVSGLAGSS